MYTIHVNVYIIHISESMSRIFSKKLGFKNMSNKKRLNLGLPMNLYNALKGVADKNRRTVTEQLKMWIEEGIGLEEITPEQRITVNELRNDCIKHLQSGG